MQLLRTFLKPGWLLATVLVGAFAAACFLILAPWQLGKNTDTEHRNDLIRAAAGTAAVPLADLVGRDTALDPGREWREATLTGTYLADEQVLVRLRSVGERPAVEVVTPFRLAGSDRVVLVDRGYVRPDAAGGISVPAPPAEQVTLHARLRTSEGTSPGKEPRVVDGRASAYTIDTAALSTATGVALDPYYVQLTANQPGGLGTIDLPQLESGPYLSYGLQWLAFGVMAPLGVGYFLYSEVKHRRALRRRADDGEAVPDTTAEDARAAERRRIRDELRDASSPDTDRSRRGGDVGVGVSAETGDDDVKAKLAQRYGR